MNACLFLEAKGIVYGKYPAPLLNGATHYATFLWKGHQCSIVGDERLYEEFEAMDVNAKVITPRPANE